MQFAELCRTWGIALTGGIASGKSTVAESLRQKGFVVIDADQVARLLVRPGTVGLKEVIKVFGAGILTPTGELDRAKMRGIVFSSPEQRIALESIIYRHLKEASEQEVTRAGLMAHPRHWFYEASLIYERQREDDFSQIWVAYCPRDIQLERLMKRDSCDRPMAESMLAAQMPAEDKAKRAHLVIHTDCDRVELEHRIEHALESIAHQSSDVKGV